MSSIDTLPVSELEELRAWKSYRSTTHFGSLDGLRCLSILAVIWQHGPGFTSSGLGLRGYMGVPLFFAISGFLITTLLLRERDRNGEISLRQFYWRRSLRIFPLYFAVLAAYCVLIYLFARGTPRAHEFYRDLPFFLTYTSNIFVPNWATFAAAWSLATEEQFYSTWPPLLRRVGSARAIRGLAVMILLAIAVNIYFYNAPMNSPGYVVSKSIPASLFWGCIAAFALHYPRSFPVLWKVLGNRWTSALLLAAILILLSFGPNNIPVHFLFAVLVAASVIREDHFLAIVLKQRAVAYIGVISYGMYLLHGIVYDAMRISPRIPSRETAGGFAVALAATIVAASVSYRFYEKPFLRMKKRHSQLTDN